MKIRNGFVSNSSSSSFIVAVDCINNSEAKITLTVNMDLKSHANHICDTVDKLDEYYLDNWGYENIEEFLQNERHHKNYKMAKNAIENGKTVLIGSFSDEGEDPVESMLCYSGLRGIVGDEIEVIQSDGGY